MAKSEKIRIPARETIMDAAGRYLYHHGAMPARKLFSEIAFSRIPGGEQDALQRALRAGWLVEKQDGNIDCSPGAREYYAIALGHVQEKPVGQIAAYRQQDVFSRPPLSRKNIPNPRGTRTDIPEWPHRPAGFGFKSICGGDA